MMRKMEFKAVNIDKISPNPFQPREQFDEEKLRELAGSFKSRGEIQPIIVREHEKGYQIIAGERRWRAAKLAGIREIPVLIRDTVEQDVLLESLIENLHRKDLTVVERENAIYKLWKSDRFKTKAELARTLGIREQIINEDIEAWEFRNKVVGIPTEIPTYVIAKTRGLEEEERKRIIEKVEREEIKRAEVGKVAKVVRKASKHVKRAILKPKSRITPITAEKILELPEERQTEAIKYIESLRLEEDEAISHIEAMKVEVPLPPPEELVKVRERYEKLQKEIKAKLGTPEAIERGELFRNWTSHIAVAGILDSISCPVCKSKQLGWICHSLTIEDALQKAERKYKQDINRSKKEK